MQADRPLTTPPGNLVGSKARRVAPVLPVRFGSARNPTRERCWGWVADWQVLNRCGR